MRSLTKLQKVVALSGAAAIVAGTAFAVIGNRSHTIAAQITPDEISSQSKRGSRLYRPTPAEWATLVTARVEQRMFRPEQTTEGKITVDDDRATPIFSPYSGRVTRLLVRPGDTVARGQPLFVVEATDMVQALNDFMSATATANKARAAFDLARSIEKRQRDLYQGKAVPLRDLQQAEADLVSAQTDLRASETALDVARNRLRSLGRGDDDISDFQSSGKIGPETPVTAPIAGTIMQRKIGPGQYVTPGASEPVFVIGDLSTVWLNAYVRETEVARIEPGQAISFTVPAYPHQIFWGKVEHIAAALDPSNHRLLVRASVDNSDGLLKPEMIATVSIVTDREDRTTAVPRDALIVEGSTARVWVARDDQTIELRTVRTGLTSGDMVQVLQGLVPGERVITSGSLFIGSATPGS
jgi:cobalt-zinc-cadmium efflux system membrane fusion protein